MSEKRERQRSQHPPCPSLSYRQHGTAASCRNQQFVKPVAAQMIQCLARVG